MSFNNLPVPGSRAAARGRHYSTISMTKTYIIFLTRREYQIPFRLTISGEECGDITHAVGIGVKDGRSATV